MVLAVQAVVELVALLVKPEQEQQIRVEAEAAKTIINLEQVLLVDQAL
jgi:hypothetical protein